MAAQPLGHLLAGLGLPAGEPRAHLQSWLLATIMLTLSALLQVLDIFRNDW